MIIIDLDICLSCRKCVKTVPGFVYYIETALRELVCKRCQKPHCLNGCYTKALHKTKDGKIEREVFLCIGCRRCAILCPLGIIPKYVLNSIQIPSTPFLPKKLSKICLNSAVVESDDIDENMYIIDGILAVRSAKWF